MPAIADNYLDRFAGFLAGAGADTLPAEVVARTKLIIADCVAAIVGGAAEPEMQAFTARVGEEQQNGALVIGSDRRVTPDKAALLNGTAGTWLEMDEGNQFCKGHPGMHTFPAALAMAETGQASGRDFLAAVTLGYEAGARVGFASNLRGSMHPHGTWGAICAAVAVARLAGADAARMRTTLNIAANLGLGTSRRTMLEGALARNTFAGISNQMGILCAQMDEAGLTGEIDGISHVYGHVLSDRFNPDIVVEALGERWEVLRNYFKMHSCCRYNHASLDVVHQLMARHGDRLSPGNIERIEVETYNLAVELADPAPKNVLAAKFSLPFAIATTLINRDSGVASFTWDKVRDAGIAALAARVTLREDPAMTARLPDRRPARVTIVLADGTRLSEETATNRGDWSDPYRPEEIREKYMALTARLWTGEGAAAVYDAIMDLENARDLSGLSRLMGAACRKG